MFAASCDAGYDDDSFVVPDAIDHAISAHTNPKCVLYQLDLDAPRRMRVPRKCVNGILYSVLVLMCYILLQLFGCAVSDEPRSKLRGFFLRKKPGGEPLTMHILGHSSPQQAVGHPGFFP